MSLIRTQAILNVTVENEGYGLLAAAESLRDALIPSEDARIVSVTQKTNWMTKWWGMTALLVVIDYTPAPAES